VERMIASLRVFLNGTWLAYAALFDWVDPVSYMVNKVLGPFTYLAFFVLLGISATGRNTAEYYIVGNAIVMASISGFAAMSLAIVNERNYGTLVYLVGSPANRLAVFFGRALINILDGATTVVICFAWGMILGLDLSRCNLLGLALAILVVTLSSTGLGLLVGSVSYVTVNVLFIVNTVFFLLLVFSSANVPLEKLPDWMQAFSAMLPLTRGIQAARLFVTGTPLAEVWSLLAGELAVGVTYALAGFAVLHWFETQARRRGTLEAF
jgi:ABC-2 type transport system permease protein